MIGSNTVRHPSRPVSRGRHRQTKPRHRLRVVKLGLPPDPDTIAISRTIARLAHDRQITLSQLCSIARLNPSVMYSYADPKWYGLRTMNISVLRRLANALGVPLRELIPP